MRTAIGLRSKAMAVHHLQKHGSFCHFVAGSCAVLYTEFTRETMRLHPPEESNLRWDRDLPPALCTGTWGPYIAKIRTAKRVWKEKALQFTHPGEKTGRVQLLDGYIPWILLVALSRTTSTVSFWRESAQGNLTFWELLHSVFLERFTELARYT